MSRSEPVSVKVTFISFLVLSALSCSCCGQEACPQLSPSITDFVPPCNTSKDCGSQSKICCDGSCVQAFCTDGASYNLSLYETYSTGGAYDCTIVECKPDGESILIADCFGILVDQCDCPYHPDAECVASCCNGTIQYFDQEGNDVTSTCNKQEDGCAELPPLSIDDYILPPCNTSKDCGSQSKICCDGSCVQAFCTDGANYNLSLYETYSTGDAYGCTIVDCKPDGELILIADCFGSLVDQCDCPYHPDAECVASCCDGTIQYFDQEGNDVTSTCNKQEDICAKVSIDDYNLPPCNTAVDCGSQSKICCDGSCVQAFCTDGASYNLSLYETYTTGNAYSCTISECKPDGESILIGDCFGSLVDQCDCPFHPDAECVASCCNGTIQYFDQEGNDVTSTCNSGNALQCWIHWLWILMILAKFLN